MTDRLLHLPRPWEHPLWGWEDLMLVKPPTCTCIVPWGTYGRLIVSDCPDHGVEAQHAKLEGARR